jgi:hypothetical protein
MIKSEIRSLVFNEAQRLDPKARYHARFLDAVIEKCLSEMLWELYALDPHYLQRFTVTCISTVDYEAAASLYYTTLPVKIIPFPDKASGVRRVNTITQPSMRFYPADYREMDALRSSSYFKEVTDKILYIVTQERVVYYGMTAAIAAEGVIMEVIQPFSQFDDTDTVYIPEFRDGEGMSFDDRVKRKLMNIPPVDLSEDTDEANKTTK